MLLLSLAEIGSTSVRSFVRSCQPPNPKESNRNVTRLEEFPLARLFPDVNNKGSTCSVAGCVIFLLLTLLGFQIWSDEVAILSPSDNENVE